MEKNREEEIIRLRPDPYEVNPLILSRWSPRALLPKPIPENDLLAILEAAHWAPSCFNEQPWRFIIARRDEDLARARACLAEVNRGWANHAPVLIIVLSAPKFSLDGSPNRWHDFDAGTAWGYLALEAHRRGLVAHGMGGFSQKKVQETYDVPEDWGIPAMVALGYRGPMEQLPLNLQEREHPTQRKALNEIWSEGKFGF
jgi:nitroreductase